jgi:hypothetical protein
MPKSAVLRCGVTLRWWLDPGDALVDRRRLYKIAHQAWGDVLFLAASFYLLKQDVARAALEITRS